MCSFLNEAVFADKAKKLHKGVRTGVHYFISLSVYCVCVTFVVSTDCDCCTRPTSINPGYMEEAGEYGLTRGTCLVASRLEVVAAAGLLWISWCVLGAAGFRCFFCFIFFERIRPAECVRPPCLIYLSTTCVF